MFSRTSTRPSAFSLRAQPPAGTSWVRRISAISPSPPSGCCDVSRGRSSLRGRASIERADGHRPERAIRSETPDEPAGRRKYECEEAKKRAAGRRLGKIRCDEEIVADIVPISMGVLTTLRKASASPHPEARSREMTAPTSPRGAFSRVRLSRFPEPRNTLHRSGGAEAIDSTRSQQPKSLPIGNATPTTIRISIAEASGLVRARTSQPRVHHRPVTRAKTSSATNHGATDSALSSTVEKGQRGIGYDREKVQYANNQNIRSVHAGGTTHATRFPHSAIVQESRSCQQLSAARCRAIAVSGSFLSRLLGRAHSLWVRHVAIAPQHTR